MSPTTTTTPAKTLDIRSLFTPQIYIHLVTMLNARTGDEQVLTVETMSDRFLDVYNEICNQRVQQNLLGYQIFEVLPCTDAF